MKKQIKMIHTADFHYSKDNQDKALLSLEIVCDKAEKEEVDLIIIAGDLFDRPVNNTESSGFPALIKIIQRMMNIAPVVAVTGTPTHDIAGCYEAFKEIEARNCFFILEPGKHYFLYLKNEKDPSCVDEWYEEDEAVMLIFGIPEPQKSWFLKDQQLGKGETDEAIKKGMRELLLGMGSLRKQYTDIPCLLIYHGAIAGSTLNNSQVLPAGGIQIGKDDLTLVGADYYALGHIHLAQQIGELPAYYPGSSFPVDWGETDQKSFFYVTIEKIDGQFISAVDRIHYPHPPRKKIVLDHWPDQEEINNMVQGFQCLVKCKMTKETRSAIDDNRLLDWINNAGAFPGSKVEVLIIPTETIRSEQITEATRLRDKVKIYADLSNEKISEDILEKADSLELTAKEEGLTGEGLHIRIKKLILRGAIGIHKGIGKDQIDINFDNYDPGLIALIGVNGSGKTTLIENMHPYIQMLTRTGKLQDHFYLRDSFRDLYFIDERTGTEYRAFMQIDGVNKSGSVECFLYRKEDGVFKPASAEINGRQAPYIDYIQSLFGSLNLFLRSAFVSQKQPKNLPDLSEATKGEKKALFRELGGLDYLQVYSEKAKEKWQALDRELIGDMSTIESLKKDVALVPEKRKELQHLDTEKTETEKRLKEIEKKGFKLKEQLEELLKKVDKNKEIRTNIENISKEITGCEEEWDSLKKKIVEYRQAIQNKGDFENHLKDLGDLRKQEAKLNEEKSKILEQREQLIAQYQHDKDTVADIEKKINAKTAEIQSKLAVTFAKMLEV
jgi:DNA repair exonuclease SbcCD nuclease subunit